MSIIASHIPYTICVSQFEHTICEHGICDAIMLIDNHKADHHKAIMLIDIHKADHHCNTPGVNHL